MAAKVRALQQWCKIQCEGYRDVEITNMTSCWKSGLAFCAIIHKYRPDMIDYDALSKENVFENNQLAFDVAYELGIPKLLDAEDMVAMRVPDKLCIVTYVSQYYNYFHNKPPQASSGGKDVKQAVKRQPTSPSQPPEAKKASRSPPLRGSDTNAENLHQNMQKRDPARSQGTLGDKCTICGEKVYMMERHIEGSKLYHRHCIRESQRASLKRPAQSQGLPSWSQASPKVQRSLGMASSNQRSPSPSPDVNTKSQGSPLPNHDPRSRKYGRPGPERDSPGHKMFVTDSPPLAHIPFIKPKVTQTSTPPVSSPPKDYSQLSKFKKPSDFVTRKNKDDMETEAEPFTKASSPEREVFFNDLSPTGNSKNSSDPKKSRLFDSGVASSGDKLGQTNRLSNSRPVEENSDVSIRAGLLQSLAKVRNDQNSNSVSSQQSKVRSSSNTKSWLSSPGEDEKKPHSKVNLAERLIAWENKEEEQSKGKIKDSSVDSTNKRSEIKQDVNRYKASYAHKTVLNDTKPDSTKLTNKPGSSVSKKDMEFSSHVDTESVKSCSGLATGRELKGLGKSGFKVDDRQSDPPKSNYKSMYAARYGKPSEPEPKSILKGKDEGAFILPGKLKATDKLIKDHSSSSIVGNGIGNNNLSAFNIMDSIDLRKTKGHTSNIVSKSTQGKTVPSNAKESNSSKSEDKSPLSKKKVNGVGAKSHSGGVGKTSGYIISEKQTSESNKDVGAKIHMSAKKETEGKPEWMLEAERRKNMRGGKYEDPEFKRVREMKESQQKLEENEHKQNNRNVSSLSHRNDLNVGKSDTRTGALNLGIRQGAKSNQAETSVSSSNRSNVLTEGKDTVASKNSPVTSPGRERPVQDNKTNAALLSIVSRQLGRKVPSPEASESVSSDRVPGKVVTRREEKVTTVKAKTVTENTSPDSPGAKKWGDKHKSSPVELNKPMQVDRSTKLINKSNTAKDMPVIGRVSDSGIRDQRPQSDYANGPAKPPRLFMNSTDKERPGSTSSASSSSLSPRSAKGDQSRPSDLPLKKVIPPPDEIKSPRGSEYLLAKKMGTGNSISPPHQPKKKIVPDRSFHFDSEGEDSPPEDSPFASHTYEQIRSPREHTYEQVPMRRHNALEPATEDAPVRKVNAEKRVSTRFIFQKLNDLDIQLRELERQGRALEDKIRSGTDDSMDDNDLMLQWFELISQKNEMVRTESELMYIQRQQELEDKHADLEYELRKLMNVPEAEKTEVNRRSEAVLLKELVEVVSQRNSIVDSMELDRLRYIKEDAEIQEMLQKKGFVKNDEREMTEKEDPKTSKQRKKEEKRRKKEEKRREKEEKKQQKEKKEDKKKKKEKGIGSPVEE